MAPGTPGPPRLSQAVVPRLSQDGQLSLPGECLYERGSNILPETRAETELTGPEED